MHQLFLFVLQHEVRGEFELAKTMCLRRTHEHARTRARTRRVLGARGAVRVQRDMPTVRGALRIDGRVLHRCAVYRPATITHTHTYIYIYTNHIYTIT